ncbi:putative UDP-arabinose 4-epimerase 1 [Asimina triloba]
MDGRSVKEFVEACKKATRVNIQVEYLPRRPGDYAEVYSDPSKINRELNWSAQYTDLQKSLEVAWGWQKSHRNGYEPLAMHLAHLSCMVSRQRSFVVLPIFTSVGANTRDLFSD